MIYCYLTIERDTTIIDERSESLRFILCHIGPYFIKKKTKNQSVQIYISGYSVLNRICNNGLMVRRAHSVTKRNFALNWPCQIRV